MSADTRWHEVTFGPQEAETELVFLHGWGHDHRAMSSLARLLSRDCRCRLYDMPGFGKTAMLPEGAGTADYAAALARVLPRRTGGRRIIVGHSFGCRVALQLAKQAPEACDELILIAAAGLKRQRSLGWRIRAAGLKLLGRLAGLSDKILRTRLKAAYSNRFGSADYRNAGPLRATFVNVVNEDLSDVARGVQQRALLIYGAEDGETPVEIGERFARLMPAAELKILDHFGHLDVLIRGVQQLATLIRRRLSLGAVEATKGPGLKGAK